MANSSDNSGFEKHLKTLKEVIPYVEDETFAWDDTIALLIIKLRNTDSLNKERNESNATQIQLTSERDASEGKRKTEDFFPTLTLNSSFKSWRIAVPARINAMNVETLKSEIGSANSRWLADSIQIRRRLLNPDASGGGNPAIHICYGNDLMPLRELLQVDDYLVIVKRKNESVYEAFGVKKDVDLGNGKQMYISDKASQDSTTFALEKIVSTKKDDILTPEWFNENGKAYLYLDEEATAEREKFLKKYAPDVLRGLEGLTLLRKIFLNDENKDNLCYELEFDATLRELFGSIKSGTAYKYGLHFSKKNQKWATGTGRNPQFLTVDEAIELGTQIRDYLVDGADVIAKYDVIDSLEGYSNLYKELNEVTDGFINRVWFLKYYQMVAPELFPPIYSQNAQTTVIKAIGEKPDDNSIVRMGQMQLFIRQCDVSPVVFSRTFWSNYDRSDDAEDEDESVVTSAPIKYDTGLDSPFERNRIVFGAPGTGKSFTINTERGKLLGDDNETDYERVTFHPDYSYANFVGTYKPVPGNEDENGVETITYKYVPGPFMRVYVEALKNGRTENPKPYLLIIEEINRANVAAVFGDIFQLLDRGDDNVSEYPIQASEDIRKYLSEELNLSPEECSKIKIPDNMFIWATMNSADQGVFPMDTAFKRRWDFTYLGIDDSDEKIRGKYVYLADDKSQKVEWNKLRKAINHFLAKEKINEDKQLGPYFISRSIVVPTVGDEIDRDHFIRVFKNKVIMYLFEDAAKQKRAKLFEGCFQDSTRYSEICREFDAKGIGIFNHEIQLETEPEEPQWAPTEDEN